MPKTAQLSGPQPEQIKPDLTQPQPGHNGPVVVDHDEIVFFVGRMREADARIRKEQKERKLIRQAAKGRGIALKTLDRVMTWEDRDEETNLQEKKDEKHYSMALNIPVGMQFDLFDGPGAARRGTPEALLQKAYDAGRRLGIKGGNPDSDAYPPVTEEGQKHLEGYNDGQKINHDKFLRFNEDMAARRAAEEAKQREKAGEEDPDPDASNDGEPEPAPEPTKH